MTKILIIIPKVEYIPNDILILLVIVGKIKTVSKALYTIGGKMITPVIRPTIDPISKQNKENKIYLKIIE